MRAEKRKKNAPKELARLKAALGQEGKGEISMQDVCETATVVPAHRLTDRVQEVEMSREDTGEQGEVYMSFHPAITFIIYIVKLFQCVVLVNTEMFRS